MSDLLMSDFAVDRRLLTVNRPHSVLKLFTGFAIAAFID
jgi:hypothetical protein